MWLLWYVLVMSRFLLLWRKFLKRFQADSTIFRVISGPNLPKPVKNGWNYFFSNSLQMTFSWFLGVKWVDFSAFSWRGAWRGGCCIRIWPESIWKMYFGVFCSDLFPKGFKVILWYVLVISRFLLLWRVFLKMFQVDSATFWVILGSNLPKMVKLLFLQLTLNYFLMVLRCKMEWSRPIFMERRLKGVVVA